MPDTPPVLAKSQRILIELRDANALAAADSRANLRPPFDAPVGKAASFGLGAEPSGSWLPNSEKREAVHGA